MWYEKYKHRRSENAHLKQNSIILKSAVRWGAGCTLYEKYREESKNIKIEENNDWWKTYLNLQEMQEEIIDLYWNYLET